MSGPKTSAYSISKALEKERRREEERRRKEEERLRQEELKKCQQLWRSIEQTRSQWSQLQQAIQQVRTKFPTEVIDVPLREIPEPATCTSTNLACYLESLQIAFRDGKTALQAATVQAEANTHMQQTLSELVGNTVETPRSAAELLGEMAAKTEREKSDIEQQKRSARIARLLKRLEQPPDVPLQTLLHELVIAVLKATDVQRAQALELELSMQIQRINAQQQAMRRHQEQAAALFATLPEPITSDEHQLSEQLRQAALGWIMLTDQMREQVSAWRDRIQAQADQRHAAAILKQGLEDLGYEVEEGFNTLFVEGGMIHFQKPSWGDYHVRLRVNTAQSQMNFNVVRAAGGGSAMPTREQRIRDQEIENEWCPDYYELMKKLGDLGIENQTVRELKAGSHPVQSVLDSSMKSHRGQRRAPAVRQSRSPD